MLRAALITLACLSAAQNANAAVLELFTSQGCSSCPPAEALLQKLDKQEGVITLAYHVTYWDYLGWADPYATPEGTARQRAYAAAGSGRVFTPEMRINGISSLVGSDARGINGAMTKNTPFVALSADATTLRLPASDLHGHEAEVLLLTVQPKAATDVTRGENAGNQLNEINLVRSIQSLGTWQGQATTRALPAAPDGTHRVVLVQYAGMGQIVGALKVD